MRTSASKASISARRALHGCPRSALPLAPDRAVRARPAASSTAARPPPRTRSRISEGPPAPPRQRLHVHRDSDDFSVRTADAGEVVAQAVEPDVQVGEVVQVDPEVGGPVAAGWGGRLAAVRTDRSRRSEGVGDPVVPGRDVVRRDGERLDTRQQPAGRALPPQPLGPADGVVPGEQRGLPVDGRRRVALGLVQRPRRRGELTGVARLGQRGAGTGPASQDVDRLPDDPGCGG